MNEWINKTWYVHPVELALERKEILTHPITWMNLEAFILSEISQSISG